LTLPTYIIIYGLVVFTSVIDPKWDWPRVYHIGVSNFFTTEISMQRK